MSVTVRIPTILRTYTDGASEVSIESTDLGTAITALDQDYPGIGARVLDEEGHLRRFINIYVDDDDVRFAQGLATVTKPGAVISIIPAVAGG